MPYDYNYTSPLDQSSWTLPSNLTLNNADKWKQQMLDEQLLDQRTQRQNIGQQARAGTQEARNMLAMRGGIGQGARERVEKSGFRNMLNSQANLGMSGAQARANIGTQAANIGMAENQFNTANILDQNQLSNQAALEKYKTQMSAWAGGQYANELRNQSSGGKK